MPGGIEITLNEKSKRLYFPVPDVTLPVLKKNEAIPFLLWGRRNEEEGLLPPGGWARLDSIKKGIWERYHPVPVKIPATGWMEKDEAGLSHYFPLKDDECIQGLVASKGIETRLYIVTIGAGDTIGIHPRAPRIIKTQKPTIFCRCLIPEHSVTTETSALDTQSHLPQQNGESHPTKALAIEKPHLPLFSAHIPLKKRTLLHCLSTIGDNSYEAITAEKRWRQLRGMHDNPA